MVGMTSASPDPVGADSSLERGVLPSGGTVRPITRWSEPVMHRVQEPITAFDDDLRALAADMVATMYAADGVGLAACQIGVDRSIFVFDCPDENGMMVQGVVCNPVIYLPEGKDRRLDDDDEGCLSFPGAFVPCARPDYAEVTGQGLDGSAVRYAGTGLLARCLQHETDHCHGTVFGDRLPRRSYKKLAKQQEAAASDFPAGWPA
jgi:peptide deformylase